MVAYFDMQIYDEIMDGADGSLSAPLAMGRLVVGHCIADLVSVGSYSHDPDDSQFIWVWKPQAREELSFRCDSDLPVRTGLSIEAGMKTRLVTSSMSSVVVISHLLRHSVSDWLSTDQKARIGFEEPDKLWEVLKFYGKQFREDTARPEETIVSTDLSEATYRMPHDLLEQNQLLIDRVFAKHPTVRVFSSLLHRHARTVFAEGQVATALGRESWTTVRGAFMGDSLSFMHLTLYMMSRDWVSSNEERGGNKYSRVTTWLRRPTGQLVGDDDLEFATPRYAEISDDFTTKTGGEVSKLHASSTFSGVFCENFFLRATDTPPNYDDASCFGDLVFLDTIKGSALSGQAKVKADGQKPALGHCKLVAKQARWHPIEWIKRRSLTLVYVTNCRDLFGLGQSRAWLPQELGGLEVGSVGLSTPEQEKNFESLAPYYSALANEAGTDHRSFLTHYLLLPGICKPNPKGFDFIIDPEEAACLSEINLVDNETVGHMGLPDWVTKAGRGTIAKYIRKKYGLIPLISLASTIARIKAMADLWAGKSPTNRAITLSSSAMAKRYRKTWKLLKKELVVVPVLRLRSPQDAAKQIRTNLYRYLFDEEDPAIRMVFGGAAQVSFDMSHEDWF
jgi:hypothetical protein